MSKSNRQRQKRKPNRRRHKTRAKRKSATQRWLESRFEEIASRVCAKGDDELDLLANAIRFSAADDILFTSHWVSGVLESARTHLPELQPTRMAEIVEAYVIWLGDDDAVDAVNSFLQRCSVELWRRRHTGEVRFLRPAVEDEEVQTKLAQFAIGWEAASFATALAGRMREGHRKAPGVQELMESVQEVVEFVGRAGVPVCFGRLDAAGFAATLHQRRLPPESIRRHLQVAANLVRSLGGLVPDDKQRAELVEELKTLAWMSNAAVA